jgi:hypothetical protein
VEWWLKGNREPLSDAHRGIAKSIEVRLEPEDRVLLLSDGWIESIGITMPEFVEQDLKRIADPQKFINEFSYRLQSSLSAQNSDEEDAMPPQDCSVIIVDIEKNILRLA